MKSNIFIIFFLSLFYFSCNNENIDKIQISTKFRKEWIEDSLGCIGYRQTLIKDSFCEIEKFTGVDYNIFIKNFGTPNFCKQHNDTTMILLYWVSCSISPQYKYVDTTKQIKSLQKNSDAMIMQVKVNADNLIRKINLIIP